MTSIDEARRWRDQNSFVGRGGVVILFEGKAQGWANMLRNPEHWQPGCVAVDEDRRSWTAVAGDEQKGGFDVAAK